MKRRKVLLGLSAVAGVAVAIPAFRFGRLNLEPDFKYLDGSLSLVSSIADVIIPKTDSPSASEAGVGQFIISMVKNCTDTVTANKFVDGLRAIEDHSRSEYNLSFIDCTDDQKKSVLGYFQGKDKPWPGLAGKVQKRYLGSPFFVTLKRYTTLGYFTSEQGATTALRYAHVPGKYVACMPYSQGDKGWCTQ